MSGNRKKTFIVFYITLISLILLAAASYAWMSISAALITSNLMMSVTADDKLELAPDVDGAPGEWSTILDLSDPSGAVPVLKPVAFSAERFAFLIPHYGLDGRVARTEPIRLIDLDEENVTHDVFVAADADTSRDYLFYYDFWMRAVSTNTITVSLSTAAIREQKELGNGTFVIGEPAWDPDAVRHEESGKGAQNAIRIGFLIDRTENDPNRYFIIYEPNADANGDRTTYSTDGEEIPLEGGFKLIRQKESTFSETDPVLRTAVLYSPGEFYDDDLSILKLYHGESRHVTMFVWLEGQDKDCSNAISEGRIFANIQFSGKGEGSPIYPD